MTAPGPPDVETAYAVLCGEPFCYRPWELARLTDRQVQDVVLRPREKDGSPRPRDDAAALPDMEPTRENQRKILFSQGAALGIPVEELERVFRERWGEP